MIIALCGLPGSGKTTAAEFLEQKGFTRVSFGKINLEELKKRGLEVNEQNEKILRDDLRKEHGMEAFAKLNISKIELISENIVIDDLMSYQEYELLSKRFKVLLVAITADEETRIRRLAHRKIRPLTSEEVKSRDYHQLNVLNLKESIAKADKTIINNSSFENLKQKIEELI